MKEVLRHSWALFFGMLLLMLGNGLQGSLLAYRGQVEGFNPTAMAVIMSGYFAGFLYGSFIVPKLIAHVGHVRVFAALGSLISAAFILFPVWPEVWVWTLLRIIIGVCFAGVYIVAESWLNNSTENSLRGQALSVYLIVQMLGVIIAAWLLNLAPVSGYTLFIIMSIAVSLSFTPILLSNEQAPPFESSATMSLRELFNVSPLGCVTTFVLGGIFALQFAMIGVYATEKGLSQVQLSGVITAIYVGGLIAQYPIGWISDRVDRRLVIIIVNLVATVSLAIGVFFTSNYWVIVGLGAVMGGVSNPLYSLAIAYTNDRVEFDKMASVSAGLMFLNGLGAIGAPLAIGVLMSRFGADTYFIAQAILFGSLAAYGIYRTTQTEAVQQSEETAYQALSPTLTPVGLEVAEEVAHEESIEAQENAAEPS